MALARMRLPAPAPVIPPGRGFLRRKCSCAKGTCAECQVARAPVAGALLVGDAHDPAEREADAAAAGAGPVTLHRSAAGPGGPSTAPHEVHEVIRSSGQPLEPAARAHFEARFGHDFGRVRIHANTRAAASARAISADAYTVGPDVVFAEGKYAPASAAGRALLGHELAHVVQDLGGDGRVRRQPAADPMREDADAIDRAGAKARQDSSNKTEMVIRAASIVYRLMRMHIPRYSALVSGVSYDDKEFGVRVESTRKSFSVTVGPRFVVLSSRWTLKDRAKELETAIRQQAPAITKLASAGAPAPQAAAPQAPAVAPGAAGAAAPHAPDGLDAVAIPALRNILCRTRTTGREHCGIIIEGPDKALRVTGPHRGDVADCSTTDQIRNDERRVAYYHSHPEGQGEGFSKPGQNGRGTGDTDRAEDLRIDYYLITPTGVMKRYIPSRDEYRAGRHVDLGPSGVTCP
ncbi:MAG TPA: DUF4157 domain-containing protein [Candidatus Binatia bacterium]|nr:DUF4157 domain-containing protein [Candidatus Binatia bacterium]